MNQALKSVVDLGVAVAKSVVDLVEKKPLSQLLLDLEAVGLDVPAVVSNAKNLGMELSALAGSDEERDLIAYVGASVAGVVSDEHAKAILLACVKLAEDLAADVPALIAAIKAPVPAADAPAKPEEQPAEAAPADPLGPVA